MTKKKKTFSEHLDTVMEENSSGIDTVVDSGRDFMKNFASFGMGMLLDAGSRTLKDKLKKGDN